MMRSPRINGESELRGNRLTQVHLEKMVIKTVCVISHFSLKIAPVVKVLHNMISRRLRSKFITAL